MALSRHCRDLKFQDFSGFWVYRKRHTHGFTLSVLARLQIIELDVREGLVFVIRIQKLFVLLALNLSEETDLSYNGLTIHFQNLREPSLRDA